MTTEKENKLLTLVPGDNFDDGDEKYIEAAEFVNTLIKSMLADPEGEIAEDSLALLASVTEDIYRDLPDLDPSLLKAELLRRCERPAILVGMLSRLVVSVIRGAERNGVAINLEAFEPPRARLSMLKDPE